MKLSPKHLAEGGDNKQKYKRDSWRLHCIKPTKHLNND